MKREFQRIEKQVAEVGELEPGNYIKKYFYRGRRYCAEDPDRRLWLSILMIPGNKTASR